MLLKIKKYWYVIVAVLVIAVFIVLKVSIDKQKLFSIIQKILKKRDEVDKEIKVREELKEKNIKKIDEEYEKKKAEIEKKVEKEFQEAKERGLLDELAIRLFSDKDNN
jgi:Na+(H+)/acetate symporter ActP